VAAALALAAALAGACASHSELRLAPIGRFDFEAGGNDEPALVAEELSGLASLGGDRYVAVSDEHACVHFMRIEVDPDSGTIVAAAFEGSLVLRDASGSSLEDGGGPSDREGIVADTAAGLLWISHESAGPGAAHPSIAAHRLDTGILVERVDPADDPGLRVFLHARRNRGFESLTRSPDGRTAWTANEEALEVDGPAASQGQGTVVRLQRMDGAFRPLAQYAYEADPLSAPIELPPLRGFEASGVSDLLALPGDVLLVLEREFGALESGMPANRIRIYRADWKAATDVSRGELSQGLVGRAFRPVNKTLLAELVFPLSNSNFEGIVLGPRLANGDWSVILIADNHSGTQQALYALRLTGLD
jgi:hypothetical protein